MTGIIALGKSMLELSHIEKSCIHCVLFQRYRLDQIIDLLFKFIVGHHCDNLLVIRFIQAAVFILIVRSRLAHELVLFQSELFRQLADDGPLLEAAIVSLGQLKVEDCCCLLAGWSW